MLAHVLPPPPPPQETYGRWAGLRYRVEDALDRGDGDLRALADHRTTTTDLRSLKDYTDTLVRSVFCLLVTCLLFAWHVHSLVIKSSL